MAVFMLTSSFVSRSRAGSALAAAAYIRGMEAKSEKGEWIQISRDYRSKEREVAHAELAIPDDAPRWARELWGQASLEEARVQAREELLREGNGVAPGASAVAGGMSPPGSGEIRGGGADGDIRDFGAGDTERVRPSPDTDGNGIPAGDAKAFVESVRSAPRADVSGTSSEDTVGDGLRDFGARVEKRAQDILSRRLWSAVDHAETRLNKFAGRAQVGRKVILALPRELGREGWVSAVRGFVREVYTDRGLVVDWAIHDRGGNPHAHMIITTRTLGETDWGAKARHMHTKAALVEQRSAWARHVNAELERAGRAERVDHRSNAARGIYLEPEGFNPHVADHAEAAGERARERDRCALAAERNMGFLLDNPEHILVVVQAQQAVFTEDDVRRALRARLPGTVPDADVRTLGDLAMKAAERGDLVRLVHDAPGGHAQYVTAARAGAETSIAAAARDLADRKLETVPAPDGGEELSDSLNRGQRAAVEAMLSADRMVMVKGRAGVGKTFTLAEAARVWRARGFEVLGAAPSGKAVQEIEGIRGMRTGTLAAWEQRWESGKLPPEGRFVLVVDEAGMVGAGQWLRIQDRVSAMGGKLVAVGDPDQLQPVSDVAGWHPAERGVGVGRVAVIDRVMRQRRAGDVLATETLAHGGEGVADAIRHYGDSGCLHLDSGTLADPVAALAKAYFASGTGERGDADPEETRVALAYTNRDVRRLNAAIRKQAIRLGTVDGTAERDYGMIARIDRSGDMPQRVEVPLGLAPGDRIMLTGPHRELGLPRSSFGTVTATREGVIDVEMDGAGKPVEIDLTEFRDIDYGFAATVHRSQGMTVDRALVLGHRMMHRHAVYVALSRHRESVAVFGRREHLETRADLVRMARAPGHLTTGLGDADDRTWVSSARSVEEVGIGGRSDWIGHGPPARSGGLLGDTHLLGVAERTAGLLASEWVEGAPLVTDGSRGHHRDPESVIDDLLERKSVFRADDVAAALARTVAEPETFLTLFRQAMSRPDLVALSETGLGGEGRVYTTSGRLREEVAAVDRGSRMAYGPVPATAPAVRLAGVDTGGLAKAQARALKYTAAGRLRLVRGGMGSGKTSIASRTADAHRRAGWRVIGAAPTGAGLDALRKAGIRNTQTVPQLLRDIDGGKTELDPATVIVLDDAGRLGTAQAAPLLERAEAAGAKLVAFLDGEVRVPVDAGPVFRALEARVGSAHLDAMHGRAPERALALRDLARGGTAGEGAVAALDAEGVIVGLGAVGAAGRTGGDFRRASEALAEGYVRDTSPDRIALAWSRAEVAEITDAIRRRMDGDDPERAGFEPIRAGGLAGLKPGDRIRFTASAAGDGIGVRAGDTAVVLGRGKSGGLAMAVTGRKGSREIDVTPADAVPEWRFAFAGTIHAELGRVRDSVHLLASRGMNRQLLVGALGTHRRSLRIVVPAAESRKLEVLNGIVRRDATPRSVLDYGFEPGLHAREALRGMSRERRPGSLAAAMGRLREIAGIPVAEGRNPLPGGFGGEAVAEVVGAAILRDGQAPESGDRLSLERYVEALCDPVAWRRMRGRIPDGTAADADREAGRVAGSSGADGNPPPVARILARGAAVAQALGEDTVADLFRAGLEHHGVRVRMAGMLQREDGPETEAFPDRPAEGWPDPAARQRRERRAARAVRRRGGLERLLATAHRSDEAIARETLDGLFGMRGTHARRRMNLYLRERASGGARGDRGKHPDIAMPERGSADTGTGHRDDLALQLACAVTQRVAADSPVHGMDLPRGIAAMLREAGAAGVAGAAVEVAARGIAERRRDADIRADAARRIEPHPSFARVARFRGEAMFGSPEKDAGWRGMVERDREALAGRPAVATPTERTVAEARAAARTPEQRALAEAVAVALGFGAPDPIGTVRSERREVADTLSRPLAVMESKEADRLVGRLYSAFTAMEIRAMGHGVPPGAESGRAGSRTLAENVIQLHRRPPDPTAPWKDLFRAHSMEMGRGRGRDRSLSLDIFG